VKQQQTVAILGTGVVGIALAKGFAGRGDRVIFGSRDLAGEKTRAALAAVPGATAASHVEAARGADMAVVALPWSAIPGTLTPGLANALAGKLVIDASNPLGVSAGKPALAIGHTDSGGETVQGLLPDARVVKAFNTITAGRMIHPSFSDGQPDMFIAGNDPAAKDAVATLLREFGWRSAIDMGDITASRLLEALAMLWISYGVRNNHWTHGFSLLNQKA
jgi:NADPH-dependent F420 reductase